MSQIGKTLVIPVKEDTKKPQPPVMEEKKTVPAETPKPEIAKGKKKNKKGKKSGFNANEND